MRKVLKPSNRSSWHFDAKIGEVVGVTRELGCSRGRCSGEPCQLEELELRFWRPRWGLEEASRIGELSGKLSGEPNSELASSLMRDRRASETSGFRSRRAWEVVVDGESLESVRLERIGAQCGERGRVLLV